ncbi:MAG TPA: peptide ABC transporter substrate-binding protein, partial [Gammaproteobacteria bacterium]|nr:peptide ABC transporter substrate-binding protein [Gammaproteobacteria bacterium]
MNNRWRSSTVIMLVITVLAVAACGPAAQPDTSQATSAPAAGSQATTVPAAGTEATAAPAAGGEATAAPAASTS